MRIVFVSSGLSAEYGGAAVSESSLASALSKHHTVTVLCEEKRVDAEFALKVGLNRVVEYSTVETFLAEVDDSHWLNRLLGEADCIHLNGHWRVNTYQLAKICKKLQKPYVLHPRGMSLIGQRKILFKKLYNELMGNFIFENASAVIALSHFETRHFASYPVKPEQIHVIPNGITVPTLSVSSKQNAPYFLYLGRLEHRKNLLFLLEGFALFLKAAPEYHLKLRGPVEKGYNELVKNKIQALQIQNNVEVLPPLYDDSKWREIHNSQAVVYPSVEEAFGRVPFEALASKTFTVIPDESGSAEYLRTLLPDCVFNLDRPQSLADTLSAVSKKEKSSNELEKAHLWVKKELDWDTISKAVLDLYSAGCGSISMSSAPASTA